MATIEHVANALKRMKDVRGAVVLLGAGCSKSAGIPLAGELMDEIERDFSPLPSGLPKTYADYMNFVAPGDRRALLAKHIDGARMNWAHIALAQLIVSGYVRCVLTTNFDPLLVRSCAMLGFFPAVYDFPSSKVFNPAEVIDPSIIYLHGQRTGFVLLNTKDEFGKNPLDAVFARAGEQRPWIVIGYSGSSDPVFEQLASCSRFDHRLFWVGYRDAPPSDKVRDQLLVEGKYADYISGYDADTFFVTLAKRLDVFPPSLFGAPLNHLRQTMAIVNPFDLPGHGGDLRELADKQTARAIELLEAENGQRSAMANALVVAGKYEEVLSEFQAGASDEINDSVAWAWVLKGLDLMNRAEADGSEKLFLEAIACDTKAAEIQPDMPDAYFNWGYALGALSKLKEGDEAKRLFDEARAKYAKARELNPNDYEIYYNLGNLFGERADSVENVGESIALLREAIELYREALKLSPGSVDVLTNLAATQKGLADLLEQPELLREAYLTYSRALDRAGGRDYDIAYGQALTAATMASIDHSFVPFASMAFERALAIRQTSEALIDWGTLLAEVDDFTSARQRYLSAESAEKGSAAYLLARLEAQTDPEAAKRWLLVARETNHLPPIDEVKDDPELAPLRELDWFKDFTR